MTHSSYYKLADDFVADIDGFARGHRDPLAKQRLAGFLCVSAVTCYELAIKEIFFEFSRKKNSVFGVFVENQYSRMNGRIKISEIKDRAANFGDKYKSRFSKLLDEQDRRSISSGGGSVVSAYSNLIVWRHTFTHEATLHSLRTYEETVDSYQRGKLVIECLAQAMRR